MQIGIYQEGELVQSHSSDDMSSEALPKMMKSLLKSFSCKGLYFAKGPGSFMAIKVTYLFLQTLHLVKKIPLYASDGFVFNENKPIKAMGKCYFVKNSNKEIETKLLEEAPFAPFVLPKKLPYEEFTDDTEPLYHLPAV